MDTILNPDITLSRRQRLARRIGNGVLVLLSAPHTTQSRDLKYPYAPDKYLYYLTGFAEPHSALLMGVINNKIVYENLLCRSRAPQEEQWEGARMGPLRARRYLYIKQSGDIIDFKSHLLKLLNKYDTVFYLLGADEKLDSLLCKYIARQRLQNRVKISRLHTLRDAAVLLDNMRMIKDDGEIKLIKRAAAISSEAQRAAMRANGKYEYQTAAALDFTYASYNAKHAFPPIVAAGANACVLHYHKNNARIFANNMVLIDTGAQWQSYATDISRVFPAGGKFSPAQAAVYNIVLSAQERALATIRPGVRWSQVEAIARRALCKGIAQLKLCGDKNAKVIDKQALYRRFYMHGLGHFIGLDVHDVGDMHEADGKSIILRAGMVLTVEPGLYIPPAADIPREYRGLGIRIEDTVIVRAQGCDVLTDAPKTIRDIEKWMIP